MVRDEKEMEYTKQLATIMILLIFDDNTYLTIDTESLDTQFNPNYANSRSKPHDFCYKLFELTFDNFNDNMTEDFNIIGFGDNCMLCICVNDNLENNTEIDIENLNHESELYETELEYDYDDYNEMFCKS